MWKWSTTEKKCKKKEEFDRETRGYLGFMLSVLRFRNAANQNSEEVKRIEFLASVLSKNDPSEIHKAFYTSEEEIAANGPHNPKECYYKTTLGCTCPLAMHTKLSTKYV